VTSKVRSLEEAVAALKWAKEKVSERF
jgi:hypothetical protein